MGGGGSYINKALKPCHRGSGEGPPRHAVWLPAHEKERGQALFSPGRGCGAERLCPAFHGTEEPVLTGDWPFPSQGLK